jgi:molybdate transport system substrate-binding protein
MRPITRSSVALATTTLALGGVAVACAGGSGGQQRVTVLAASSLTDVFEDLEASFERSHPYVDLVVSTGGSPSLAAQAAEGAPAAVLITADEQSMERAVDAGVVDGEPRRIAANTVTIAAPTDPPGPTVDRPEDLADPDLLVALCAPEVPCGGAALELLDAAGIAVEADSLESSVQGVVTRLRLGEVDAGVTYSTDVTGSGGELRAVEDDIPDTVGSVRYSGAALDSQPGGRAVLDFLLSADGRRILADHGFAQP